MNAFKTECQKRWNPYLLTTRGGLLLLKCWEIIFVPLIVLFYLLQFKGKNNPIFAAPSIINTD